MECPNETRIAEFVAHVLPAAHAARIEAHLADCNDCRNLVFALASNAPASTAHPSTAHPSSAGWGYVAKRDNRVEPAAADYPTLVAVEPQHYVLGDEIARGGMGRIRIARDRRLGRAVAIKEVIADATELSTRFEREARITARLQHPSIVNVHEAGVWPTGQPFFAMKLVSGRSFDRIIAEATTLEARLALLPTMLAVADAIAYAHGERVIHRDLKPQNILVGAFGEVVVIDWGLAKDLMREAPDQPNELDPSDAVAVTAAGKVMGTAAYMPPEQALGKPVDERADVYALGALLFHLLAGQMPVTGSSAKEVLAKIIEGRAPELAEVQPGVPPDLLAIVAKAMAFAAADRYASALELADDLRRYHTGQLVGAHRYSVGQLLRRWFRRHRTVTTAAAAATIVLLVVGAVSVQRIIQAERVAAAERKLAVEHRADAEELMTFMLGDLRDKLEPLGKLEMLDTVAKKSQAYYDKRSDPSNPESQRKRALARRNLGDVLQAQGDLAAAMTEYRTAFAIVGTLAAIDPSNTDAQRDLAAIHVKVGDMIMDQGDIAGALASYRASLAIKETLVGRDPTNAALQRDVAISHDRVADALVQAGDLAGSLAAARASLAIREKLAARDASDPTLLYALSVSHSKVGNAYVDQGDLPNALAAHQAGLAISEQLAARDPTNTTWQRDLSNSYTAVGDVIRDQGDRTRALAAYHKSLVITERLAASDPTNTLWQRDLLVTHTKVGETLSVDGDAAGALAALRAARAIAEKLVAMDPNNAGWQRDLAINHFDMGHALLAQGDAAKALVEYRGALAIRKQLAAADPANAIAQHDLWLGHIKVGAVLHEQHERVEALREYRAALAIIEKLAAADADSGTLQFELGGSHEVIGDVLRSQREEAAAVTEYRTAQRIFRELTTREPTNEKWKAGLASLLAKAPQQAK